MREEGELLSDRPADELAEEAKTGEEGIVEETVGIGGGGQKDGGK